MNKYVSKTWNETNLSLLVLYEFMKGNHFFPTFSTFIIHQMKQNTTSVVSQLYGDF